MGYGDGVLARKVLNRFNSERRNGLAQVNGRLAQVDGERFCFAVGGVGAAVYEESFGLFRLDRKDAHVGEFFLHGGSDLHLN